ncbi:MAG: trigger factor [Anaerolineaceae bacterium 4572_78]|nr:MAG: trigger factor [Anaerolineaceae bacterium 4572_78]
MKVTIEEINDCEIAMTIELDDQQKRKLYRKAGQRIAKNVKIPGFRPGKAPYIHVFKRFGEEAIQQESINDLGDEIFKKALKETNYVPYSTPEIENIDWNPITMTVKFFSMPQVELGDYHAIRLDYETPIVSDEEIEAEVTKFREEYSPFKEVNQPAQSGDIVTMTINEVDSQSGDKREAIINLDLPKAGQESKDNFADFIPHVMGLSVGEMYDFTQTLLDGHEIECTLTVKKVKRRVVNLDDDSFVQNIGQFKSLSELKEQIRKAISEKKQTQIDNFLFSQGLEIIISEMITLKWPSLLEDEEVKKSIRYYEDELRKAKTTLNDYLRENKKRIEEFREEVRENVIEHIKTTLVLKEIAKKEDLQVDLQEVSLQAQYMTYLYSDNKSMVEQLNSPDYIQHLADNLHNDKIRKRLIDIIKGQFDQTN